MLYKSINQLKTIIMKKINLLTISLFTAIIANAQLFGFSAGVKQLNVKNGEIYFVYQDESPVPDIIETRVILKNQKYGVNVTFDYETEQAPKKIYGIFRLEGYTGEITGGGIGIGIGYPIFLEPKGKIRFHPEISAMLGLNKKDLGTLVVQASGSVYIQVNDTRYGDYEDVDVALKNYYYGIKPAASLSFSLGTKTYLRLFGGYHFDFNISEVSFTGQNNAQEEVKEIEKLKDKNLYFEVNGKNTNKTPFAAGGLELRLGIIFNL